jgi:hypothetical protein
MPVESFGEHALIVGVNVENGDAIAPTGKTEGVARRKLDG